MILFGKMPTSVLALCVFLGGASAQAAQELPPASSSPVLVVSGAINCANDVNKAVFDIGMLQDMPRTEVTTSTIWTDGKHVFTGVALVDFLPAICPTGRVLKARAINDYVVEIPLSDAVRNGPIIAYLMDGQEMSVRGKGPLWMIYPYDAKPEYQNELVYSRSIWQLDSIVVAD